MGGQRNFPGAPTAHVATPEETPQETPMKGSEGGRGPSEMPMWVRGPLPTLPPNFYKPPRGLRGLTEHFRAFKEEERRVTQFLMAHNPEVPRCSIKIFSGCPGAHRALFV